MSNIWSRLPLSIFINTSNIHSRPLQQLSTDQSTHHHQPWSIALDHGRLCSVTVYHARFRVRVRITFRVRARVRIKVRGSLIKRSVMLNHGRSLLTTVKHTQSRSILLDHGRPWLTTVILLLIPYAQSIVCSRSTLADRSMNHGRSSLIDQPHMVNGTVDHVRSISQSIGAQLLQWPTLVILAAQN